MVRSFEAGDALLWAGSVHGPDRGGLRGSLSVQAVIERYHRCFLDVLEHHGVTEADGLRFLHDLLRCILATPAEVG